jgi:FO synthase
LAQLVRAGINDWGGVSPVTPDHVNPEAPWPHLKELEMATAAAGRTLVERLALYPAYVRDAKRWVSPKLMTPLLRLEDTAGLAREDDWAPGTVEELPQAMLARAGKREAKPHAGIARILDKAARGARLGEADIVRMFNARGPDFSAICAYADDLRRRRVGDEVTYVVNRNINYTNICTYGCKFCAFSKGRHNLGHRDKPYNLTFDDIGERSAEAWARGATEVCLQGGIKPGYTGETYQGIVRAVKSAVPDMHVHAFSPLEVWHGASTLKLSLVDYLSRLKAVGLGTLPGTAAEILDDEVRAILCPDKINTAQWFEVMRAAHAVGLRSTATIMFGHVDRYEHWARHILRIAELQRQTGGFTEFVPLAFVHMEAPIYLKGNARKGPTFREAVLMHAVARIAFDGLIDNIQASWVKMGPEGAQALLNAGCNDMGGVLMNESITRAAGAAHGQELTASAIERMIHAAGRTPRQRTTLYETPSDERIALAMAALPLPSIGDVPLPPVAAE